MSFTESSPSLSKKILSTEAQTYYHCLLIIWHDQMLSFSAQEKAAGEGEEKAKEAAQGIYLFIYFC